MARRHVRIDVQEKGLDHSKPHTNLFKGTLETSIASELRVETVTNAIETLASADTSVVQETPKIVEGVDSKLTPVVQSLKNGLVELPKELVETAETPDVKATVTPTMQKKRPPPPRAKKASIKVDAPQAD